MHDIVLRVLGELKGSWRFRWIAMALAWVVCLVGWAFVYTIPNTFKSEAIVYIDTTSALDPLLGDLTINNDVRSRVDLVTTAMLGRPQLQAVAEKTGMASRARTVRELDDVLVGLYRRTEITNSTGRAKSVYTISYEDEDPHMAQMVVETMLNTFVQNSMGENRLDTENAQAFIKAQLEELELELTDAEQRLAEFKKMNVGRMPGEGGGYFSRLQTEMTELEKTQATLRQTTRRKEVLERQLKGESPGLSAASAGVQSELDLRISANQSKLEEMQLRFTDKHPDVISVKETLAQLREQKEQQLNQLRDFPDAGVTSDNPVYQNIQIELTNANVEIAELLERQDSHNRRIAEYRDLVDVLPEVEAELIRLTRDYDVRERQYQSLLGRLNVAELSQEADRSEDVQFRIIDPPIVQDKPVAPDRPLLLAAVLLAGLGSGGAGAFLINLLKPVFSDARTLRSIAGFPVLASVAAFPNVDRRHVRILQFGAYGGALAALCFLFGIVLVLRQPIGELVQALL